MKRVLLRAVSLAACLMMLTAAVSAQTVMRVYVGEGAMREEIVRQLIEQLNRKFPQAEFEWVDQEEGNLRDLVLGDRTPQLAVCSPREAAVWAKEGLTLPLQRRISNQEDIAQEVLAVCVQDENLFMAPLLARHREMAVNVKLFEKQALGYMLDEIAHPVWYPTEFQQILEEFAIADKSALELWLEEPEGVPTMEAMVQAIYCGGLLGDDGVTCRADDKSIYSGVRWLRDLIEGELIGLAETRQDALERFLAGETAIFAEWTRELQQQYARQMKDAGMIVRTRPYPSSSGLPVRHYELTGVSVFDSGALEAAKVYSLWMIDELHDRAEVAKYFDASSDAYSRIVKSTELWMQDHAGYRFENDEVTDYARYSDDIFSLKVKTDLIVTRTNGTEKVYAFNQSMFFQKNEAGKWLCFESTNVDVSEPVGKVRLTFMQGDTQLTTDFYETDAKFVIAPSLPVPEGQVFSGWVTVSKNENGDTVYNVELPASEDGTVNLPEGYTLRPMVLYALFQDASEVAALESVPAETAPAETAAAETVPETTAAVETAAPATTEGV